MESYGTPEVIDLRGSSRARVLPPAVVSVSSDREHRFSKTVASEIRLLAGLGVEGNAHAGVTVQHRSRVAADPSQPNLRRVHLIPVELFGELAALGFAPDRPLPPRLRKQVVGRAADGSVVRRAGVMGIVLSGGSVRPRDPIAVDLPPLPHAPLDRV